MAFIPDEAVDRMRELSAGAWRLYCFLARCRNQKTGKCCPSINVTMETIGTKRRQTFELRKELAKAGWATFEGNTVTGLFGFDSAKNRTVNAEPAGFSGESAGNRTPEPEINTNSAKNCTVSQLTSAGNRTTQCEKSHSTVQKIALAYKEEPAKEPANRTSKDKARQSSAVPPSVAYVRQLTHRYPDKTLWPRIVQTLGEDFNQERLTECYENWVSHGWNKMNLVWVFEWYTQGIPANRSGRLKPTLAERNQAAFDEAARQLGIYDGNVIEGEVL